MRSAVRASTIPARAARLAAMASAGAIALAGCGTTIAGAPHPRAANPTEPTVGTSTRTVPRPAPSVTPTEKALPSPGPRGQVLAPLNGYVFVATKSGKTRCQLSTDDVGCEAAFTGGPEVDGVPANGVSVDAAGHQRWILGNLGDPPVVTLDYRRYTAVGWTIDAAESGTRFTNDRTGHGMFVAIDRVQAF